MVLGFRDFFEFHVLCQFFIFFIESCLIKGDGLNSFC
jgi:hypothetical protein